MSRASSPTLSTAAMSLASEVSWDSCHRTNKSTPIAGREVIPVGGDGNETALKLELDAGSPSSANRHNALSEVEDHAETVFEKPESMDPLTPSAMVNEPAVDPKFCFADSNITVQAEESLFRVHEFKLNEFQNLMPLIGAAQTDSEGRKTVRLEETAEDIRNMFTVLYSSTYAPESFDAATLKSTLRFATLYGHAQLRATTIGRLEKLALPPIERFALSRDFNVESWMSKALDDLCCREKSLTAEEGEVLGVRKFAEVAARREERLSRSRFANVFTPVLNAAKAATQIAQTSASAGASKIAPSVVASNATTSSEPAVTENTLGHSEPESSALSSSPRFDSALVSSPVSAWLSSSRSALVGVTSVSARNFGLNPPVPNSSWWSSLGSKKSPQS
ncbi:hypothetical protein BDV93DRAFT_524269 [Ceratobasidium sp. AG-I]|nr:hypothetical protein BDV93DRAFT_524269 [Ceratobasidium sp. AG-I]